MSGDFLPDVGAVWGLAAPSEPLRLLLGSPFECEKILISILLNATELTILPSARQTSGAAKPNKSNYKSNRFVR
jgi:hypothetical protein